MHGEHATATVRSSPRRAGDERFAALTSREAEVAQLAAAGMTNAEIARALFLSTKTVGAHLERVYRKLDVHRRAQLALLLAERQPQ